MLKEIISDANHRLARRWFRGSDLDLLIWYQEASSALHAENITAFELSDHSGTPVALKWTRGKGLTWHHIDGGESRPGHHKSSPLLLQQPIDNEQAQALLNRLTACRGELDQDSYERVRLAALGHLN